MSFRTRLVAAAAAAVAGGVVVASAIVFFIVRSELRGTVDDSLQHKAARLANGPFPLDEEPGRPESSRRPPPPWLEERGHYLQLIDASGKVSLPPGERVRLPVTGRMRDVAAGNEDSFFSDANVAGTHVRMFTAPLAPGVALQVTRPLTDVDSELSRIKLWLFLVALGGIATAVAIGLIVARAATRPLQKLTQTAEHVTRTRDLGSRIDVGGSDELGRLAATLNTMLEALEEAVQATEQAVKSQRQLVADASHELSTPLTSLRTNIELLLRNGRVSESEREEIARDVVEQLGEMGNLIDELVELARGDERSLEPEEVRLDLVVDEAIARVLRAFPQVDVVADVQPTVVWGVQPMIARAVSNLLENAAKWSPPGHPIEVRVADGVLTVRDRGPGIPEHDLPHVFDRFYRSRAARRTPGSGLGLAIVKQVAEAHGGTVSATSTGARGTLMRLALPTGPRETITEPHTGG